MFKAFNHTLNIYLNISLMKWGRDIYFESIAIIQRMTFRTNYLSFYSFTLPWTSNYVLVLHQRHGVRQKIKKAFICTNVSSTDESLCICVHEYFELRYINCCQSMQQWNF